MRLDLFLKKSLLFKQRSLAQKACEKKLIRVNYQTAKSGKKISQNDLIEIELPLHYRMIKVLEIPKGNVPKKKAATLYEIIKDDRKKNLDHYSLL